MHVPKLRFGAATSETVKVLLNFIVPRKTPKTPKTPNFNLFKFNAL